MTNLRTAPLLSDGASLPLMLCYAFGAGVLGALAWVVLPWATAFALVMPFLLGLLNSQRAAFALAGGYYLGAMSFMGVQAVAGGLNVGASIGMMAVWLFGAGVAGALWSQVIDPKGRAVHTGLRLLVVWLLALFTPLGLFGLAHPLWGWAFSGDGFMGVASLLVAPALTAFLVLAMRHQRHDGSPPWSWHSGRVLSIALCAVLIGKGSVDQPRVGTQAGQAVGLQSKWGPLHEGAGPTREERLQRIKDALKGFNPGQTEQPLVGLLLTGQGAFGDVPGTGEKASRLLTSEDQRGISVGLGVRARVRGQAQPAVDLLPTKGPPRLICGFGLPALAWSWAETEVDDCLAATRTMVVPIAAGQTQTLRVVLGDEALFGGLQVLEQWRRPQQSLALITAADNQAQTYLHAVQVKHFKAASLILKTPHLLATNQLVAID